MINVQQVLLPVEKIFPEAGTVPTILESLLKDDSSGITLYQQSEQINNPLREVL
jgi:hypothetical protein